MRRYARQILLAPIAGAGQLRFAQSSILLHGDAALAATYLAAAGLGRLLTTGAAPELAAQDPAFELESGAPLAAGADLVLDLGDGAAYAAAVGKRLWGGVDGGRLLLGVEPRPCAPPAPGARAVLQTLAAGEALLRLIRDEGRVYDYNARSGA